MRTDPAEALALARYRVIAEVINPRLSGSERGHLVRHLAGQAHPQPDGTPRVYTRQTLDRWVRAYRERGLDGLTPQVRADLGLVRRHPELLGEAEDLRQEPQRLPALALARRGRAIHQLPDGWHPELPSFQRFRKVVSSALAHSSTSRGAPPPHGACHASTAGFTLASV